jgi:hypothetical protein
LLSLPATASEWVRVKTNASNNIYSVDVASIEGSGRIRKFWSNIEFGKPELVAGKQTYSAIYYLSVDCQSKLYNLHFTRYLDRNSQTVQEDNYGDGQGFVAPISGSSEEASMKFVCSRRR